MLLIEKHKATSIAPIGVGLAVFDAVLTEAIPTLRPYNTYIIIKWLNIHWCYT